MKKAFVLAAALLIVSCNSKNNQVIPIERPMKKTGETVEITAENWNFGQQTYTVSAGEITIQLKNKEGFHGIHIEGTDISIEGDGMYTTTLKPGQYTIVCNIVCGTGHQNMIASLIVEE